MQKIGFLIWVLEGQNEIFAKKACELVENEINETGGIAGKKISIQLQTLPDHNLTAQTSFSKIIRQSPDLLFGCIPFVPGPEHLESIKKIGSNTKVLFTHFDLAWDQKTPVHNNIFNISKYGIPNNETMPPIIDALSADSVVLFHMDITNPESYRSKLPLNLQSNFSSVGFDFSEIEFTDGLRAKIHPILSDINKNQVIFLNTTDNISEIVYHFLNNNNLNNQVVTFHLGQSLKNIDKILFPLIEYTFNGHDFTLGMESVFERIGMEVPKIEYQNWFEQLDLIYLIQYAADRRRIKYLSTEQFIDDITRSINEIDGKNDIFIGKNSIYYFENNSNTKTDSFLYQYPISLQDYDSKVPLLYPKQIRKEDGYLIFIDVNYVYIDILRVTNIDIGEAAWSCEFNLDIVSQFPDPIEIIKFNNLSSSNHKFEYKKISEKSTGKDNEKTYRYFVSATFDFDAVADNFPFDQQHVYISYSVTDENRFGIIQPTPEKLVDRDFNVEGWYLADSKSGVVRRKSVRNEGSELYKIVEVSEEIRLGWNLRRSNSITVLKVMIPLSFLLFLVYYTLFTGIEQANTAIGILSTAFLAGIALYFSTERPQPLRMTTIDLIFAFFYCISGVTVVLTAIGLISNSFYPWIMDGLKILIPLSVVSFAIYVRRRIKSIRLRPRID